MGIVKGVLCTDQNEKTTHFWNMIVKGFFKNDVQFMVHIGHTRTSATK